MSLDELISAAGIRYASQHEHETYRVLAGLPLPIYITTNPGNLLGDALRAAGREPVVEICRWSEELTTVPSIYDSEPDYRPTAQRPLVYHLFGRLHEAESVVLTEDDYFDYLIGVTSNNDLIPAAVRRALTDTALLFLGFNLEEWDFRVLFRSIMQREGRNRRGRYAHIAAQIDPEQGQNPGARRRAALPGGILRRRRHQHLLGQRRGFRARTCPTTVQTHLNSTNGFVNATVACSQLPISDL